MKKTFVIRSEARLSRRPWPNGDRTTLAAVNDRLSQSGDWFHPTKGFRTISDKRMEATMQVAEIKSRVFMTAQGCAPKNYPPHAGTREAARRVRQMKHLPNHL